MRKYQLNFYIFLIVICINFLSGNVWAGAIIADHTLTGYWSEIPTSVINQIVDDFDIYYCHTSHGGQIITGFTELTDYDNRFPDLNYYPYEIIYEVGDDLGYAGDTSWAAPTRTYLNSHPDCNVAMYSWCGGVSYQTENGINIYLNKMTELEIQYPNVTFIYMTGHLDGTGPSGNLYVRNNQIRDYCTANNKVLFDFADIESYDPDDNYYPYESDSCAWCHDWCGDIDNECDDECYCAHSHCFNCRLKAQTWWVMMAYLTGWTVTDIETDDAPLPEKTYLYQNYPNPFNESTIIKYELPHELLVSIKIFTVDGRLVTTLVEENKPAGVHRVAWNAADYSAGVYLAKIKTLYYSDSIKLILLK